MARSSEITLVPPPASRAFFGLGTERSLPSLSPVQPLRMRKRLILRERLLEITLGRMGSHMASCCSLAATDVTRKTGWSFSTSTDRGRSRLPRSRRSEDLPQNAGMPSRASSHVPAAAPVKYSHQMASMKAACIRVSSPRDIPRVGTQRPDATGASRKVHGNQRCHLVDHPGDERRANRERRRPGQCRGLRAIALASQARNLQSSNSGPEARRCECSCHRCE